MAEFLLREGADVNIVDKDQRSDQNDDIYHQFLCLSLLVSSFFGCFFFLPLDPL